MSAAVALRLGIIVAGVVVNEVDRYKRSRREKRRKQQKLLKGREDQHRIEYRPRSNSESDYGSSDDEFDAGHRQALVPRSNSLPHIPQYHPPPPEQRPRQHPRAKTFHSPRKSQRQVIDQGIWLLDTGATQHSCSNASLFTTYTRHPPGHAFARGIGRDLLSVLGTGTVRLHVLVDGLPRVLDLHNVAHIPDQQCEHLMAFDPFLKDGGRLWTEGWTTYVADRFGEVKLQCHRVDGACRVILDPRVEGRTKEEMDWIRNRLREGSAPQPMMQR